MAHDYDDHKQLFTFKGGDQMVGDKVYFAPHCDLFNHNTMDTGGTGYFYQFINNQLIMSWEGATDGIESNQIYSEPIMRLDDTGLWDEKLWKHGYKNANA